MENEELALRYQQGQTEVIGTLWGGVEKYVYHYANQFARDRLRPDCGATLEDLEQTGFIAVEEAARTYDPEGGAKFITWLSFYLLKEFKIVAGLHRKHPDPLNDRHTLRLDVPLDAEDAESDTLGDVTPDDRADIDAAVVDVVYQEQLRAALDDAMNDLPEVEREVLERKYYRCEGREKIAVSLGLPNADTVTRRERCGLEHLSNGAHGRKLEAFLHDEVNPYAGGGLFSFRHNGASSVEIAAERREKLTRKWEKENNRHLEDSTT